MIHWLWLIPAAILGSGITLLFLSAWAINEESKSEIWEECE